MHISRCFISFKSFIVGTLSSSSKMDSISSRHFSWCSWCCARRKREKAIEAPTESWPCGSVNWKDTEASVIIYSHSQHECASLINNIMFSKVMIGIRDFQHVVQKRFSFRRFPILRRLTPSPYHLHCEFIQSPLLVQFFRCSFCELVYPIE